ncbi:transcription initiation factor TFIID subunit 8-like [Brassica napus]|nr:transcription initiation factor TFIID subunit 8-like [Brassica napus]
MTNGGGGEGGGSGKGNLFRGNDFAYALARMAVAQICEGVEITSYQESHAREGARFSSFHETALETLTEVVIQYIQSVGKTTQFYANMAGRVEGNAMDIVQALEDLGSGLGFSGAPDVERCLAESGVVKDIIRYTAEAEEVPFVYSLPRFPFNRGKRPAPSFAEVGAELPDEHIPVWLPAFPQTKVSNELEEDTSVEKIQGEVQSNENGSSLPRLQQSVEVDRLKVQKSMDQKEVEKPSEEQPECNPFLAAPVWVGEKNVPRVFRPSLLTNEEVSAGHVPEKQTNKSHHMPPLEAFAPSGIIKDKSRLGETEGGERNDDGRTQRALLRFKIGTRKAAPVRWTRKESLEEKGWFLEDGDKREKNVELEEEPVTIDTNVK